MDHTILLRKLKSVGLADSSTEWFQYYLSNRYQLTAVGSNASEKLPITIGVSQGSILGPLLFSIYINDLPDSLENCTVSVYADDTIIYYSSPSAAELEQNLNTDLRNIAEWLHANRLTLNVKKSKSMLIGSPRKLCNPSFTALNLKVANSNLDGVSNFKHLRASINRTMTWHDHVERISKQINRLLGLLRRIKHVLPYQTRLSFYHSLVLPLFDYADIIWGVTRITQR